MIQINANSGSHVSLTKTEQSVALKTRDNLEADKKKLYKAAKEMESLFLYHMLQAMRKTVPENDKSSSGFSSNLGKDVYTQIFDQELAMNVAGNHNSSLADLLYKSMEKVVERQAGIVVDNAETGRMILPRKVHIPIREADLFSHSAKHSDKSIIQSKKNSSQQHGKSRKPRKCPGI